MADFTWIPSLGFTAESNPRTLIASFGDGYSQRVADGINTMKQSWSLRFVSSSITDAIAIENFLISKGGVTSFTWIPPGDVQEVKVICPKWGTSYDSHISRTITATFEKVYL